ncbi:MAG TPA: membrane dipeptidase [Patescibacteria group bacterium]|nr:membrane dipeptidase [Patescibacteria group bacterium]
MKIFDLHIDLSSFCLTAERKNILEKNDIGDFFLPDQVDIPRLKEGEVKMFLANVCPILATPSGFEMPENSFDETIKQIDFYKNLEGIELVRKINPKEKGISALLSIEGAYFIQKTEDLTLLTDLKKLGVVSIAPTWNIDNKLGTGAGSKKSGTGLTKLGIEFIDECERLGIIIDAVHASRKTFQDINRISKRPFFVSHTAAFGINNHKRNLNDEEIKQVATSGGIIGLSFIKDFIGQNSPEMVTKHLKHLINIAGEDHVAIGGDFDGMSQDDLIEGLEDISKMQKLFELFEKTIPVKTLEKIANSNAEKFFRDLL